MGTESRGFLSVFGVRGLVTQVLIMITSKNS